MIDVSTASARRTGRGLLLIALALGFGWAGAPSPAAAQSTVPPVEEESPGDAPALSDPPAYLEPIPAADLIGEQEWREIASGKTLRYESAAGLVGHEYYVPGGNRVIFVYFDGRCFDGQWAYVDGYYCFEYDGFYCFEHFHRDGEIMVRERDGGEQRVAGITDEILSCEPQLLSRAERSIVERFLDAAPANKLPARRERAGGQTPSQG